MRHESHRWGRHEEPKIYAGMRMGVGERVQGYVNKNREAL